MLFSCLPLQGEGDRVSGGGGAQKPATICIDRRYFGVHLIRALRAHLLLKEKAFFLHHFFISQI